MKDIVLKLNNEHNLSNNEIKSLLICNDEDVLNLLFEKARETAKQIYGNKIYIRGLIEFSNYCKNDCYYCGIRKSNLNASRYRLSKEEILDCCSAGYELGFRTFVLQGGEDGFYSDNKFIDIISSIKSLYPDCAVTLSAGEKSRESYKQFFDAGADRYLLRHETASKEHYSMLHPKNLSLENRIKCLYDLKEIGYQVGCGFMVGSPFQTIDNIVQDLRFIKEFNPEMVGIGPFICHKDTPFKNERCGTLDDTLKLLSIIRLLIPNVLLPATTALGTIDESGREKGILCGANVVMPNLSPIDVRSKYLLYDNKISTGSEAAECVADLKARVSSIGYEVSVDRGDCKKMN